MGFFPNELVYLHQYTAKGYAICLLAYPPISHPLVPRFWLISEDLFHHYIVPE